MNNVSVILKTFKINIGFYFKIFAKSGRKKHFSVISCLQLNFLYLIRQDGRLQILIERN